MAEVLIAVRLGDRSGRTFVVKRPRLGERPSGRAAQAIQREAEVLQEVRAPGLVPLEAAGAIAGLPYVAIEHVRAASLDRVLASGPLDAEGVRAVARDLAAALAALHAAGWVHRDVAPANVLVDDAGEVRLIDLGLAARAGARGDELAGTPGYVAPEAVRGVEVQPAEDVYALAAVVAECAVGRPLFPERELADAAARGDGSGDLDALDRLAPELSDPIRSALRRDPSARPSAKAIAQAAGEEPLDREALAARVERVLASADAAEPTAATDAHPDARAKPRSPAEPPALTPTAPMVTTARAPSVPPDAAAPAAVPAPARGTPGAWRAVAIALLVVLAAFAGLVAGRRSLRGRESSIVFAGAFPARTSLELDGRPTAPTADGRPQPVAPGLHHLVVALRGERREYAFHVRPGEKVVLVPILRGGGASEPAQPRNP